MPQAALLAAVRGYASKDVRFGIECREAVLAGVNKLADAVQVTLGPKVRGSENLDRQGTEGQPAAAAAAAVVTQPPGYCVATHCVTPTLIGHPHP